jgi:glyoxylase-like metal-dependent hydrolase (beta-lactamase superfamily II)
MKPVAHVHAFYHRPSSTLTYVLWDGQGDAVVIDPVIDYDPATQMVSTASLEKLRHFVARKQLRVHWILETHVHADHLSGARELKREWPSARWGMGAAIHTVLENFRKAFAWSNEVQLARLGVDRLFGDGEEFTAGGLRLQALSTPGHTPACVTYKIGRKLFTGDAIMMPDGGTGRCDFPGGSAAQLYRSIWSKLYAFPAEYQVYVGHDYQPAGRPLRYMTTIGEQKAKNIHLRTTTSSEDFISFREGRDKSLSAPRLLNPSLDWNLGAHQLVKPLN